MKHKSTLESLKLCDIMTFIETYGLCRSDDFTIGSLTDFSAMKRLDIEQIILLGDPDTFCHACLQADCSEHHLYRRAYSSRQPKLYRLRNVLPPSIRELTIRRVQPGISGHLIELAEVHEASFPHLTKIRLVHWWYSGNSGEVVRGILWSVGDAFGPTVSLHPKFPESKDREDTDEYQEESEEDSFEEEDVDEDEAGLDGNEVD